MPTDDLKIAIYTQAMRLAAERGWARLTMGEIAEAANISLAELHAVAAWKGDILTGISDEADRQVLAAAAELSLDDPARDRLFDVIMQRFEALRPYREGIGAVLRDFGGDPAAAAALVGGLGRSMSWMLEAAKVPATGPLAPLRIAALGALYASLVRTWLRDDGVDYGRTMAALDARLKQVGRWLGVG